MQRASAAKINKENAVSKMTGMTENYESAKTRLSSGIFQPGDSGYAENQKIITDYEKNFPTIQQEVNELSTQYDSIVKDINVNNNLMESIDKYQVSVEDENRIRKEMAGVQKDINTLSSEKKQREKFYHYDPSPTEDVKKVQSKYSDPTTGPGSE